MEEDERGDSRVARCPHHVAALGSEVAAAAVDSELDARDSEFRDVGDCDTVDEEPRRDADDGVHNEMEELEPDDAHASFIADDIDKSGPSAQELEAVLQHAPFGFTQVELELTGATRKRSTLVVVSALAKELASIQLSTRHESEKRRREIVAERKRKLQAALRLLLTFAALLEALYVLVSVPLRVGFLFDPWSPIAERGVWTSDLTVLSALDVVAELVLLTYVYVERKTLGASVARGTSSEGSAKSAASARSAGRSSAVAPQPSSVRLARRRSLPTTSLFSVRDDDNAGAANDVPSFEVASVIQDALPQHRTPALFKVFLLLPLDMLAAALLNYSWLHLARAARLVVAAYSLPLLYASATKSCRQLEPVRLLSFSTLHLPFQLFWLGLYLCHVSACGYMLLAHVECGVDFAACSRAPVPGCWVLKDRLERGSFWRQYVRTMYWASKTITTLGQGDLVPATQAETNYCIVVQFVSGLWATAFLSACSFYFSRRDADLENCASTRLEQALTFLRNRRVPTELAAHIRAYHQYLQRTRNGVEETRVLTDLPTHYHKQCADYVTLRLLRRVPFFAKQPKELLRTLLARTESDFLSPNQTVVGVGDLEELLVVGRGELRVLDVERSAVVHAVGSGQWLAEHALFHDSLSRFEVVASTFCEVYCLSRQSFLAAMDEHFPKMKIALLQVQYVHEAGLMPGSPLSSSTTTAAAGAADTRLANFGSVRKSSHLLQAAAAAPWRFPDSRFRRAWRRWKVALTIYLAVAVPFEVAFDWRGGVLGPEQSPRQLASYAVALAVELFFYVDVYLRVRVFARTGKPSGAHHEASRGRPAAPPRLHQELIVRDAELTTHYLLHGDVLLDLVATLPVSMVWKLLSKDAVAYATLYYMRFFRLLALVRLAKLRRMMRKILRERDVSPASQLLATVVAFCVVSASAVACAFFLTADVAGSDAGSPPGFGGSGSVSVERCLEDASVAGNCTWFVYDLSAFAIHARYVRALHWSVVLLSTVGYGDILAFSDSECVLGFWWIFLGALICYFTACAVSSVVSQATVLDAMRSRRAEATNRALVRSGVSNATRRVIRRHLETNWSRNGSVVREAGLLQHLPRSQRYELACSLYLADLAACYVFAGAPSAFLKDVALLLRSEVFVPRVVLLNLGHLATELFLIQSGDVEVLVPRANQRQRVFASDFVARLGAAADTPPADSRLRTTTPAVVPTRTQQQRTRRGVWDVSDGSAMLPIAVLRRGDCFGEESLLSAERFESGVSVRTVTSTQVAVLERGDALALLERYPEEAAALHAAVLARRREDAALVRRLRANLAGKDKVQGFVGGSASLFVEAPVHASRVIGPESRRYKAWRAVQGTILLYNLFQITFRVAFLPAPSAAAMRVLTAVDYACDALLVADMYLKWHRLGFTRYGDRVVDEAAIRRRYLRTWFRLDCASMLPTYYVGDPFAMTLCRLPRLLRTPQLLEMVGELEERMRERLLRRGNLAPLSWFDLLKFLLLFLAAAHHVGSVYYTLGRLLVQYELAPVSWITVDSVLTAYPDSLAVHYLRSLYWCLGTFTVVCFGDVVARNAVETVFSGCACVIGWVCIGQIMGKITSLMAVMDRDRHEHNERVEAFEQFAKKKRLPAYLRERSKEGIEYKSTCLIDLRLAETFRELPRALHVLLFDELYGDLVRGIPELTDVLLEPQLQAFTDALRLELFLPEDLIVEEGRAGSKLFLMKRGAAELFSPRAQITFAAVHEGILFGDVAFFLAGTKQLVSIRASRSCEVLYLHRRDWRQLWTEATRAAIERRLEPAMKRKYRSMVMVFVNIFKNVEPGSGSTSHAEDEIAEEEHDDTGLLGAGRVRHGSAAARYALGGTVKGSRSKLSALLGLPQHRQPPLGPPQASVIDIEEEWGRHTRNLEVIGTLDHDGTDVQAFAEQASNSGSESSSEMPTHTPTHEVHTPDAGSGSLTSALTRLQRLHVPFVQATPHRGSELRLYATHLETLKARSKRRLHERDAGVQAKSFEIWVEPRLPPAFCLEGSSFRHAWNAVMLAICWYYILVVPFRISFDFEFLTRPENAAAVRAWFALEYLLDALCVTDFVLQRSYFTYVYKGEVVTDRRAIRAHYLAHGSCVSDLACILPLEALAPLYSALRRQQGVRWDVTWYRVAVFRTNKMARILRLHALSEQLQRTLVYDWKLAAATPSAVHLARVASDFALGAHWVACFFYAVSYNTFAEDGRLSWLTAPGMLAFGGCAGVEGIGDVPVAHKFARAYHFSMGAITTVSYGDIAPLNAVETLAGTLVIVVSIVLFGMLAGGFFHLYEMELGQRADYEERVARVASYMVFHRFHPRIWRQLQVYFAVHWRESKGRDEDELLRGLPTSVRQDVALYVKREFVGQMALFARCEEAFVRAVVTAFQQELYVRHDVIIAAGDAGRSLYVIESGSVLVRRREPAEVVEVVKGRFDYFGEKSLVLDVPRSATCVALAACSMLVLTLERYREILDDFPEYRERSMRDWLVVDPADDGGGGAGSKRLEVV